ncbi:hypothetical protein N9N03_01230 [Chlamydiia bacterium]|nr:hypothetical protein [Chlamydiia bacterium]
MSLTYKVLYTLMLCFIFTRIVMLIATPAADTYVDIRQKTQMISFLEGDQIKGEWETKLPQEKRQQLYISLTDKQKDTLFHEHQKIQAVREKSSLETLLFYVYETALSIPYLSIMWWLYFAVMIIYAMKGYRYVTFACISVPFFGLIIFNKTPYEEHTSFCNDPSIMQYFAVNPFDIDTNEKLENIYKHYLISYQLGISLNNTDADFNDLFHKAWYYYQSDIISNKHKTPQSFKWADSIGILTSMLFVSLTVLDKKKTPHK